MTVVDWLLEGDPAIRWQVLRDLTPCLARGGRSRASPRRARGLGRSAPRRRGCRRPVGWRRLLPWAATRAANPVSPGPPPCTRCRRSCSWGWTRRPRPPGGWSPLDRRERALGARRAAVLRRRGRAVHQRPHDRGRRLLRGGRRPDRRAGSRRAAGRRRLELRGRERVGALLVPHDDRRARRAARVRATRPAARPPCSEARRSGEEYLLERDAVPAQEHRRGGRSERSSTSPSPTTGATTCCAPSTTSVAHGRRPGSADGGGGRGRAVQAATRRPLAARPHPSGPGPLRPRGRRRHAQPVEHARAPCGCSTGGTARRRAPLTAPGPVRRGREASRSRAAGRPRSHPSRSG